MVIDGKTYTIDQLKDRFLKTDMFFKEKVESGSHDDILDKPPIETTYPNIHMRYDESEVVLRGEGEIEDRDYTFLGRVGTNIYSCKSRTLHKEQDASGESEETEIP